jgi:type VI protein secretion system component Hcp
MSQDGKPLGEEREREIGELNMYFVITLHENTVTNIHMHLPAADDWWMKKIK